METQPENSSINQETATLVRSNRELAVLYTIAGHLNRKVDVYEALQEVLAQVTNLLGLQTGWVWLLDQQGEPYLAAAQSLPPYLADHPERMTGYCLCLDTFLEGCLEGAANIDVFRCSRLKKAERDSDPTSWGLRFHASVPIYASATPLGVLNVASEDWRELLPEELQLLHIIGDQIGLAQQDCEGAELTVQFSCPPDLTFPQHSTRLEVGIYRIAQEALANACKHAGAQHIEMMLTGDNEYVELVVQDDGRGFDPDRVTKISGEVQYFGLTGMSERVKLLEGTLSIESELGAGTRIVARVPYRGKGQ